MNAANLETLKHWFREAGASKRPGGRVDVGVHSLFGWLLNTLRRQPAV